MATAMNLLFQGMAFMQVGQEFLRTKLVATGEDGEVTPKDRERAMNSYNAPDAVNQVDWNLVSVNKDTVDYVRQLIHLKKTLPALSLESYEEIYQHVFVHTADMGSGVVVFELNWDKHYYVILTPVDYHSISRTQIILSSLLEIVEINVHSMLRI